jgi:outer membrane protein assembly factor BamB
MLLVAGCSSKDKKPLEGGGVVPTQDWRAHFGVVKISEGSVLVSMPNSDDPSKRASIVKVDVDGISEWFKLPPHPETGPARPAGLALGSDGNLYWADSHELSAGVAGKNVSRLCRIIIEKGKPVRNEVLVKGFFRASGVAAREDAIYVSESSLVPDVAAGAPHKSGVYMFELKELDPAKPIKLEVGGNDEHLIYTLETKNGTVGVRGLAFATDGTMYVGNSDGAKIMAIKLDEFGNIETVKTLGENQGMKSVGGLQFDKGSGLLYCADFIANAIHEIDPKTGKVTIARFGLRK